MAFLTSLARASRNSLAWGWSLVRPVIPGMVGSILAGVFLALTFFLCREFLFPLSKVSGPWFCLMKTEQASIQKLEGKFIGWRVLLAQSNRDIAGSLEKSWDQTASPRRLSGNRIQQGTIDGFSGKTT